MSRSVNSAIPRPQLSMMRQLPTLLKIRIAAPRRHMAVEVSPMEPGIQPMNASNQEMFRSEVMAIASVAAPLEAK